MRCELLECHSQAVAADDRGMQAACDLAQLVERRCDLTPCCLEPCGCVRVLSELLLEPAQLEGQRDQALLRAVVQVALQPLSLALPCCENSRA
jgi:hypothetical protein